MAGTFTLTGLSATEPFGSRTFGPITVIGNVVIGETLAVPLISGDNTFAVPAGSAAVTIVTAQPNTATITYRTSLNSSDGGLPINGLAQPFLHVFPATAPTTLILNAQSAVSAPTTIAFI